MPEAHSGSRPDLQVLCWGPQGLGHVYSRGQLPMAEHVRVHLAGPFSSGNRHWDHVDSEMHVCWMQHRVRVRVASLIGTEFLQL